MQGVLKTLEGCKETMAGYDEKLDELLDPYLGTENPRDHLVNTVANYLAFTGSARFAEPEYVELYNEGTQYVTDPDMVPLAIGGAAVVFGMRTLSTAWDLRQSLNEYLEDEKQQLDQR